MNPTRGILYVAYGDQARNQALLSIKTLFNHHT